MKTTLAHYQQLFDQNRFPHSLIIQGDLDHTRPFVKALARHLLCHQKDAAHIRRLDHLLAHNHYGNYLEIKSLESQILVSHMEPFHTFAQRASFHDGVRIVVIDHLDIMNRFASNSLLKILEEPPKDLYIMLLAIQLHNVLPTIQSRCHCLSLANDNTIPLSHDTSPHIDPEATQFAQECVDLALQGKTNDILALCDQAIGKNTDRYSDIVLLCLDYARHMILENKRYDLSQGWLQAARFWQEASISHLDPKQRYIGFLIYLTTRLGD